MSTIVLEFNNIKIDRPKKRWNLYFVILTEHPDDPDKWLVAELPSHPMKLTPNHDNEYFFGAEGAGADGLFVLEKKMPANRRINVHCYLRHARKHTQSLGSILTKITEELNDDSLETVTDILGTTSMPWLVIGKAVMSEIGPILKRIPDKDFGFVSMYEEFGPEFEGQTELDRKNIFTGNAEICWTWALKG